MSTANQSEDIHNQYIKPSDILREEDALTIRFQGEKLSLEDARKKAIHTLKAKYSQYDY